MFVFIFNFYTKVKYYFVLSVHYIVHILLSTRKLLRFIPIVFSLNSIAISVVLLLHAGQCCTPVYHGPLLFS